MPMGNGLRERMAEILDQVCDVFDTDREPNRYWQRHRASWPLVQSEDPTSVHCGLKNTADSSCPLMLPRAHQTLISMSSFTKCTAPSAIAKLRPWG